MFTLTHNQVRNILLTPLPFFKHLAFSPRLAFISKRKIVSHAAGKISFVRSSKDMPELTRLGKKWGLEVK